MVYHRYKLHRHHFCIPVIENCDRNLVYYPDDDFRNDEAKQISLRLQRQLSTPPIPQ